MTLKVPIVFISTLKSIWEGLISTFFSSKINLDISAGYSHNIIFDIPTEIKVVAETEKGKAPIVTISGCDKQLVGAVAARIRAERKPEPYKGKGIRYVDEYVRKKAGKTAAA